MQNTITWCFPHSPVTPLMEEVTGVDVDVDVAVEKPAVNLFKKVFWQQRWQEVLRMKYVYLTVLAILGIMTIVLAVTKKSNDDPLTEKLGVSNLTYWSILHILFYVIVGYLFPNYFVTAQLLGIGWELFECGAGWATHHLFPGNNWWYGVGSDIVMNVIGFLIGAYLRTKF